MTLIELQNTKATAVDEQRAIIALAEKEARKLTDAEDTKIAALLTVIKNAADEIAKAEAADNVAEAETKSKNKNITIINKKMNEKRFSFARAINAVAYNKPLQDSEIRFMEIGNKAFSTNGLTTKGQIQLPLSTNRDYAEMYGMSEVEKRAVMAAAGNASVATEVMDLIAPLYAQNPLIQMGAQVLYATANVTYPSQTAIVLDYVNGENIAETDVTPTNTAGLALTPKRIAGYVDISKTLLVQENPANEAIIKSSIVGAINSAIIKAVVDGHSHLAYKPDSLFTGTGFTYQMTGATGLGVYNLIAMLDTANALEGSLAFLTHPMLAYKFRQVPAFASATVPILQGRNDLVGYPVFYTSAMSSTLNSSNYGILFGDWSKFVMAFFGSTPESLGTLGILVDPYSAAINNAVRLHIEVYQDMGPVRQASFIRGYGK
jgi:HK97 family phage major capsid protein